MIQPGSNAGPLKVVPSAEADSIRADPPAIRRAGMHPASLRNSEAAAELRSVERA
jgi:hypothetical protein